MIYKFIIWKSTLDQFFMCFVSISKFLIIYISLVIIMCLRDESLQQLNTLLGFQLLSYFLTLKVNFVYFPLKELDFFGFKDIPIKCQNYRFTGET